MADLGVNVLWLMPIHPIGQKNSVGSPYCVRDYKGVHSSFGTLDDLKRLIADAHAKKRPSAILPVQREAVDGEPVKRLVGSRLIIENAGVQYSVLGQKL